MNGLDIEECLQLNGRGLLYWAGDSTPPQPDDLTYAIKEDSGEYLVDDYGRYILADSI